jgi:hypothetical protein
MVPLQVADEKSRIYHIEFETLEKQCRSYLRNIKTAINYFSQTFCTLSTLIYHRKNLPNTSFYSKYVASVLYSTRTYYCILREFRLWRNAAGILAFFILQPKMLSLCALSWQCSLIYFLITSILFIPDNLHLFFYVRVPTIQSKNVATMFCYFKNSRY